MNFTPHVLSQNLSPFIQSIFHYSGFQPDHSIERVIPSGHVFIIFELDGLERNTFHNDTLQVKGTFNEVWLSGAHKDYLSISAHQNSEMLVVQFKPEGALPFIHQPGVNYSGQIVSAKELVGEGVYELRLALLDKEDVQEKFQIIEDWLMSRFNPELIPPAEFCELVDKLQHEPVQKLISLLDAYPTSQKHAIDQFKKYVGLTPKQFQRIVRFNQILKSVQQEERIEWSQIAYQCGYSDQSHFIKEFQHFSGFNPTEFISNDFHQDESNFLPLDR